MLALAPTLTTYHYPPRPEQACAVPQINAYEADGWVAQLKMDGTCGVISVTAAGGWNAMSRHGPDMPMKRWNHTAEHRRDMQALCAGDGLYVFCAEVMDGRVNEPHLDKKPIFIHDILVADGRPLTGKTYDERLALLATLTQAPEPTQNAPFHVITDRVYLARTYRSDLVKTYRELERMRQWFPEYEGLVLKNPRARLANCDRNGPNAKWQVKSRFPTDKDGIVRRSF